MKTKGVFVFGTSKGEVLYFNISRLPNIVAANVLMNQSTYHSAYVDRSSNEEYVSVTYEQSTILWVFLTSNWTSYNTDTGFIWIQSHAWTSGGSEGDRVFVFPYHNNSYLAYSIIET